MQQHHLLHATACKQESAIESTYQNDDDDDDDDDDMDYSMLTPEMLHRST